MVAADYSHHGETEVRSRWSDVPRALACDFCASSRPFTALPQKGENTPANFLSVGRRSVGLLLGLGGGRGNRLPEHDGDRVGLGRARGAAAVGDDFFQECVQSRHDLGMLAV